MTLSVTPATMANLHARTFVVPRPWTEAEIAAAVADPLGIAITESQGFLLGRVVAGEAELLTIAVEPDARRQGIGRRLVTQFISGALARGAEAIFLEVAESNRAARALYETCGFCQCGHRKAYYHDSLGQSEDALILAWKI